MWGRPCVTSSVTLRRLVPGWAPPPGEENKTMVGRPAGKTGGKVALEEEVLGGTTG